jgi:hypothetical protein
MTRSTMASACVGTPIKSSQAVHGNLTGDDERGLVVTVLDDFEQIAHLIAVRASGPHPG